MGQEMSGTYEPIAKPSDKRGLALFEEIINEIESHDFLTWDQTRWLGRAENADFGDFEIELLRPEVRETLVPAFDCGTVACLFGHAVFKAGATMVVNRDGGDGDDEAWISSRVVRDGGGEVRLIDRYAAELLELPPGLALWISSENRTWKDIVQFRDAWRNDAESSPNVTRARDAAAWPPAEEERW
jgi:hypothetical protein